MPKPVIIVGAGVAGLTCARRLNQAGIPTVVLEKSDGVGGRLRTDEREGFLLDRGFQVLFTAYPTAKEELDFPRLDLKKFSPGALIWDGQMNLIDAGNPIGLALSSYISLADKLRLADWTLDALGMSVRQIERLPEMPAERAFRQAGFTNDFIDAFARPFLGGVFMDRSLAFSRRALTFVWKMLNAGDTVIPSAGIQAIPDQLAQGVDVETGVRVVELRGGGRVTGVALADGSHRDAAAVVIATEAPEAASLSGFETPQQAVGQVCLHFGAETPPVDDSMIVLRKGDGLTNMVVPMSNIAPELAPSGQHLVSATILGQSPSSDEGLADAVKAEVSPWFPARDVEAWRLLRVDRIPYAQFAQPPHFAAHLPSNTPGRNGLYFAGEFTVGSSIEGAMQSGADCARLVIEDLAGVHA